MRYQSILILSLVLLSASWWGAVAGGRDIATLDDGNMLLFVSNNGTFAFDPNLTRGDYSGLYYPRSSYRWVMAGGGIWVAGKKGRDWRVTISGAESEFVPGTAYHRGKPPDPFPIYKITRGENYALNDDYRNWPSTFGAPTDFFGQPLISGGQSLFTLFTDTDTAAHGFDISGTLPLGVEVKCYAYTYDNIYQSLDTTMSQVVFLDYTVINASRELIDSCIISIYADPDIGYGYTDRVGCDSALNAAYCYNESDYDVYYGKMPPVSGLCLLENQTGSINFYYAYSRVDPPSVRLDSLYKTINLVKGMKLLGDRYIDPTTHAPTNYPYSGNPAEGTGWINSVSHDYRFVLNTAPVRLPAGDSIKVKAALVVAQGATAKESIRRFLETARMLRSLYFSDTTRPSSKIFPSDVVEIDGSSVRGRDWGGRYLSGGLDLASRYFGYDMFQTSLSSVTISFGGQPAQRAYRFTRDGSQYRYRDFMLNPVAVFDAHTGKQYDCAFIDTDDDGSIADHSGELEPLIIFTIQYGDKPKSLLTPSDLASPAGYKLLALHLDATPQALAGSALTINTEALVQPFQQLDDIITVSEPVAGSYSERVLSFSNPTLFTQEIDINTTDPLHLVITPSRFELGVAENRNIFLHYYPPDSGEFTATITVSCYSYRNSSQTYPVRVSSGSAAVLGDINDNQTLDLGDLLQMVNILYRNRSVTVPEWKIDANCDGVFNLSDLMVFVNALYQQAEFPCDRKGKL